MPNEVLEEEGKKPEDAEDQELETELASAAIDDGKGNKMVPLSALAGSKKEARALAKKVKELEAQGVKFKDIETRLNNAQPIIDAIVSDPKMLARAKQIASGVKPTGDRVEQPDVHDDPDAVALAETMDLYTKEGQLDVVRARKMLELVDKRSGRVATETMRPFAGMALNQRAETNLTRISAMTDDDGVPWATSESIREVAKMLPEQLLADPNVSELVLNSAIGIDRRKGRTPKAPDEVLHLESVGGRRRVDDTERTQEEKQYALKSGLTEKDLTATAERLKKMAPSGAVPLE